MFDGMPALSGHPTAWAALEAILSADPGGSDVDGCLENIVALEKIVACAQAAQIRWTAQFSMLRAADDGPSDGEFDAVELSCALSVTGQAARARLDLAATLTRRLPLTLAAMQRGDIDLYKARTLAEVTEPLSDLDAGAVEEQVLGRASQQTGPQLRASARRAVLRADPDGAAKRHEHRNADRRVEVYPLEDGMAALNATLPATQAVAIYGRLDAIARDADPDDPRGMDARRADALADLLLAERPGQAGDPLARVHVTVPASTLAGESDEPGDLAGYGPIPAHAARQAAAHGVWKRLVTDPLTGALLDYGRTTYRPPADLADYVRARDVTCRFPGCRQAAHRCDLDHTVPYPDGPTDRDNLGALCRRHHRLKHQTAWQVTQPADGVLRWTSPTGRVYTTTPEPLGETPPTPPPEPPEPSPDTAPDPMPDDDSPPF